MTASTLNHRPSQNTRQTFLNIGLELFSAQTYEAVGVSDIVTKAGITKPSLYHHFGSKLGFYTAVFEYYCAPYFDMMAQKTEYQHDFIHNLNEIATCSLAFFMENPRVFWMLEFASHVSVDTEHFDFVQKYWIKLHQRVQHLFEQAVVQHGNLKDKTTLAAWTFLHTIRAQIYLVLIEPNAYRQDLPYKLVHQFMYGILA